MSWFGSPRARPNRPCLGEPKCVAQRVTVNGSYLRGLRTLAGPSDEIVGGLAHGVGGGKARCGRGRGGRRLTVNGDKLDQLAQAKGGGGAHKRSGAQSGGKFGV